MNELVTSQKRVKAENDISVSICGLVLNIPEKSSTHEFLIGYTVYRDETIEDAVDWFTLNLSGLYEQIQIESNPIHYKTELELFLSLKLLEDQLLPAELYKPLSIHIQNGLNEISQKKYTVNGLFIKPPKPGRKKGSGVNEHIVIREYLKERGNYNTKKQTYEQIAERHFVSLETVRRIVERYNTRRRKKRGEFKK